MSTTTSAPPPQQFKAVISVSKYDKALSGMLTVVMGMSVLLTLLIVVWLAVRVVPPPSSVPVEIVDLGNEGGYEDGDPDGTGEIGTDEYALDEPGGVTADPSITEASSLDASMSVADAADFADASDAADVVDSLDASDAGPSVAVSERSAVPLDQMDFGSQGSGTSRRGTPNGNGRRALGTGGGTRGGVPREDRWVVRFDESTVDEYAKQLDFFKLELGALFANGRLVMISNVAAARPTKREVTSGKGEERLYMKWRAGSRQKADMDLFKKAGENVEGATILHFYPKETELNLLQVETTYRNRKSTEIRKTYFAVRKEGNAYRFAVTSQSTLR